MDSEHVRIDSDAWLALSATLREIEERKREFPPSSREFLALARQVEELSRIVFALSQRQRADSAAALAAGTATTALVDTAPARAASLIIEEWRDAERRLSFAPPDSPDFIEALQQAERLRAEYRHATRRDGDGSGGR